MPVLAERLQPRRRSDCCGARGIGNKQIGAAVAMVMMMAARKRLAGFFISGSVTEMFGVIVMAAGHRINGEIGRPAMVMSDHDRRRVPDLIHRFCRHRCRIEHQYQDAERRDQAVQGGQRTDYHGFACKGPGDD